jgi:chromate transporter
MRGDASLALIAVFVPFSLASIGGGPSILAGIQHQAVDVNHWVTSREFIELFAISRAAPGPGSMLSTLIGWHVDGLTGALVATLALFVPSSLLCVSVAAVWNRHRGKRWHTALEQGLAPVGTGLILAGSLSILRLSGGGVLSYVLAFGSAAVLIWWPRLSPLLLLVLGACIAVSVRAVAG